MAAIWVFRVAIKLAPLGPPLLRYVETHDPIQPLRIGQSWLDRLSMSQESDEALSVALSDSLGYSAAVTTFSGSFEVRRAQVSFLMTSASGIDEDVRVCTFHQIKLASGSPIDTWVAGDFSGTVTAITTFWDAIKAYFPDKLVLDSIKFYREGPGIEPPQPPVYVQAALASAGGSGFPSLPPQCAISVTEKAGTKLHWGRFYLPAIAHTLSPSTQTMTNWGRPTSAMLNVFANAADTLYEGRKAANLPFVVYRRPLPARTKKNNAPLAARSASAWTVDDLQIDDVFDVIRTRRFDAPTLRVQRAIA